MFINEYDILIDNILDNLFDNLDISKIDSKYLENKLSDNFKYIIPTYEPNNNWKNLDFDDLLWPQGVSGFGYGDGDDATLIPDGALSIT